VSPNSGAGRSQAFRVTASHPAGAAAIGDLQILFDEKLTPTGAGACWIDVNSSKSVAVRKDDGSAWLPYLAIGAPGSSANRACSVTASQAKVEANGPELAVTVSVDFAPGFQGPKKVWVIASGPQRHSGWQERGSWTVN
jgi:hypothetical protein